MELDFLNEPNLEFGTNKHIDIRYGLTHYFPVDFDHPRAPKVIKIGFIGTSESIEGVTNWLEKCQLEIPAKPSNQPTLFPMFPGFNLDNGFRSTILLHSDFYRSIPDRELRELSIEKNKDKRVEMVVALFIKEMRYLKEKFSLDLIICAVPQIVLELTFSNIGMSEEDEEKDKKSFKNIDFHDLLKAKSLELDTPIQLVIPSTYDKSKVRPLKTMLSGSRMLQDEATRAWNFHTALYYKAKGVPWRLERNASDLATCYMGVAFYRSLDKNSLRTSVAQVFNERGEGIIVRGGFAKFDKSDRQVHLSAESAYELIANTLYQYKREHRHFPARVVLHKSSRHSVEEVNGFLEGAKSCGVDNVELLSLERSFHRLFRNGQYPPLRGTFLSLDNENHLLYTRGSVNYFTTYPGLYVPKTLMIKCDSVDSSPKILAREILSLTKMNWNNTQFDGSLPITLRAARQVGKILRYTNHDDPISSYYRFYM